jgi:hypothetical protein
MQSIPAHITIPTNIPHRLHPTPIPNLPILDIGTNFYDYACAFMTGRPHVEITHAGHGEVFHHVVEVGVADAGCVEAEEDVIWS